MSLPLNFSQVSGTVWRSAQPVDGNWTDIKNLGVRQIVKLNAESEGSDDAGEAIGLDIVRCPIEPIDAGSILQRAGAIFEAPDEETIDAALTAMASSISTLVHCTHGNDRTGLLVAFYRVIVQQTPKWSAWNEMIARGFHPELLGLDKEWFYGHPKVLAATTK